MAEENKSHMHIEALNGDDINTWRVATAFHVGQLVPMVDGDEDDDGRILMIEIETCDVDRRNEMAVRYGIMDMDAIASFIGSAAMTLINDEDEARCIAKAQAVVQAFSAMIEVMSQEE